MAGIFTRIVSGEIPCYKILENEEFFAFLDINPLAEGHTLVIPKKEIDYIFDIDDDVLQRMIVFSKSIAVALKKACPCIKVGMAVVGLEVPHAHIHLIPMNRVSDMNFANPKKHFTREEYIATVERIRSYI